MGPEVSASDRATQFRFYGPEPIVSNVKFEDDAKYTKVLNWYHAMCGLKEARKYLNDFFVFYDKDYPKYAYYLRLVPDEWINFTAAWQSRIIMRGATLCLHNYEFFQHKVDEMLSRMDTTQVSVLPRPSVQDHIAEKAAGLIAELEGMIDDGEIYLGWQLIPYLKKEGYSGTVVYRLIDHFEPIVDELLDAVAGEDPQLVEGYSHLTEEELLRTTALYRSLLDGVKKFCEEVKKPKAPWGSKSRGGVKKPKRRKKRK